jgi:hypothetical protein
MITSLLHSHTDTATGTTDNNRGSISVARAR